MPACSASDCTYCCRYLVQPLMTALQYFRLFAKQQGICEGLEGLERHGCASVPSYRQLMVITPGYRPTV